MALTAATGKRRDDLARLRTDLAERYWANEPIEELVGDLTAGVDVLIRGIWQDHLGDCRNVALFAVGGYGRGELHPQSDIDLLVVATKPAAITREIELFLQDVFDLNVEVGHSVRDLKACKRESQNDITVATAMFRAALPRG